MRRPRAPVTWIHADLLAWHPERHYALWHDRAVFHFLTDPRDRATYLTTLRAALAGGGTIVLATLAPAHCSGLPVIRYGPADLADEVAAAFGGAVTITGHHSERHHTPTGATQPFTWITARPT